MASLTFNDWRPLESFDSLGTLKPGTEVFIYDPTVDPPVFRAFFRRVTRDKRYREIEGIVYEIAPGEEVEVIANRYRRVMKAPLPTYAPKNRVGFSRAFDLDHLHHVGGYDA
jgi:hypothetical protein